MMLAPPRRKNQAPFHRDFMGVSKLQHPLPARVLPGGAEGGSGGWFAGRDTALLPREGVPPGECHAVEKKLFPVAEEHCETRPRGARQVRGARGKKRSLGVLKAEGRGRGIWGAAPGPAPPLPAGSGPITAASALPATAARQPLSSRAAMTPGRRPLSPARPARNGNRRTAAASGGREERVMLLRDGQRDLGSLRLPLN